MITSSANHLFANKGFRPVPCFPYGEDIRKILARAANWCLEALPNTVSAHAAAARMAANDFPATVFASGGGISFREAQEKSPAFTSIQQAVNETIHSINDVDHELLHLFVTKSRDLRPGDLAIRAVHQNIRVVTRCRARRNACVQIFEA
jgi:hypothetical protein